MSYIVLARKYRPQNFSEIIGQEHIVRTLQNAIRLERIHHAFLFTGTRGVGKTTTARVLAQALNCQKGPTTDPCGQCANCIEIARSGSPDVLEIDGASNRGVDSVRQLRETVRYAPNKAKYKLYIIDEVHQLTNEAFNALLKTLEEPPPHVKFIFATTEAQKIPATILSRCQCFDFRRVSIATLQQHLKSILEKEGLSLGASALLAIVREAQGSVRDALSLLDQVLSYAAEQADDDKIIEALGVIQREVVFDITDALLERDADRLLSLIADVDARGHDLSELIGLLVEHCRDLVVCQVVQDPTKMLVDRSPGEIAALQKTAPRLSPSELQRYFSVLVGVAEDLNRSLFPRLSLEMGLLRLLSIEPLTQVSKLVERLDQFLSGDETESGPGVTNAHVASEVSTRSTVALRSGTTPATCSVGVASDSSVDTTASDSTWQQWTGLVEKVRRTRPALACLLEHGRPLLFSPQGVEIGYTKNTFYWESAHERGNRTQLEQSLNEHFGCSVSLQIASLEEEEKKEIATIAEAEGKRAKANAEQIRETALNHPTVKNAVNILGGQIKEVIPLTSSHDE